MRGAVWLIGGIVLVDLLVVAWLLARAALRDRRLATARRIVCPAALPTAGEPGLGPG
jgi:hypothetical protein